VVVAARARAGRRSATSVASLVDEIFAGMPGRALPDSVTRTLEALDSARQRPSAAVPAAA
jgi:hypothetical protein